MQHPPRVSIAFEQERARAGNRLFSASNRDPLLLNNDLPYEHAARLLRHLIENGLEHGPNYNGSIILIARALSVGGARFATRAHVAEYLFYRLRGIPRAACRTDQLLSNTIATFYASWVAAPSVRREWCHSSNK